MITLTRKGLTLSISEGMIPARGSQNVPVRYVNDIDEYANYLITPVVGWTERNGLPKSSIAEYSDGIIKLPARAFAQSCMASIAIKMTDSSDPTHVEVTYPQSFFIEKAPDGTLILPPTDEEWKQYIDDFVTQYFNQNIDPEMDEFQAEIIQRQNIYETQLSQNQADFEEQINTDFDNFIERVDGNPEALYRGYLISKNNVYSGIASNDGINLGKVVGKSIQNGTPTPDSPVEIENVNITKLYSHTRNLFDASKLPTTSQGGATITNNEDGSFTITGSGKLTTTFYSAYTYHKDIAMKLLKVGKVNGKVEQIVNPSYVFGIYAKEISSSITALYGSKALNNSIDITDDMLNKIQSEKYVLRVIIYGDNGTEIKQGTIKPMIYQDGDGTWEPFNFSEIETDITLAEDDVYENNKILLDRKQVVFDGSSDEDWRWGVVPYITIEDSKPKGNILCNKLSSYIYTNGYKDGITINPNKQLCIKVSDAGYTDLETYKTWLQSNPITVEYQLATPITEYIDVPTLPSYYPNTVASHNSVIEPAEIEWHVETEKGLENTYRPNLLDNGDFLIWQYGENFTINSDEKQFTASRWWCWSSAGHTVEKNADGGIKVTTKGQTCGLYQNKEVHLENGKTYTLSAMIDGVLKKLTFTYDGSDSFIKTNTYLGVYYENGGFRVGVIFEANKTSVCKYVKFEEGSYATPFVSKGYSAEMIECMRYRTKFSVSFAMTNSLTYKISFPIKMRATPGYWFSEVVYGTSADDLQTSIVTDSSKGVVVANVTDELITFRQNFKNGVIAITFTIELNAEIY